MIPDNLNTNEVKTLKDIFQDKIDSDLDNILINLVLESDQITLEDLQVDLDELKTLTNLYQNEKIKFNKKYIKSSLERLINDINDNFYNLETIPIFVDSYISYYDLSPSEFFMVDHLGETLEEIAHDIRDNGFEFILGDCDSVLIYSGSYSA